jgi:ABC-2 type transport system permease protein
MLIAMASVINGGLAMAHEWETKTIKELLFAPMSGSAILIGKVSVGFLTTLLLGGGVLGTAFVVGWIHPEGIYWVTALVTVMCMALMGTALGVTLGASLQRLQKVIGIGINISLYLFFLSGGASVVAFLDSWLQTIAVFDPFTYGRHALEMAVLYHSSAFFGRDIAILAGCALITLLIGTLVIRREIAH